MASRAWSCVLVAACACAILDPKRLGMYTELHATWRSNHRKIDSVSGNATAALRRYSVPKLPKSASVNRSGVANLPMQRHSRTSGCVFILFGLVRW